MCIIDAPHGTVGGRAAAARGFKMTTELKEEEILDCPWARQALTVERVSAARLPTEVGEFRIAGYRSKTSDEEFVVLYNG